MIYILSVEGITEGNKMLEAIKTQYENLITQAQETIEDAIQAICIAEKLTFDYEGFEMVHDETGEEIEHSEIRELWESFDMFNKSMANFSIDKNGKLLSNHIRKIN